MNKVRVLQILGSLGIGGNEIFVMNYYRYIDKQKFQVDFLIFDGTRLDFQKEILQLGGNVYICPKNANGFVRQSWFVYQFLKKHSYDIVHCHNCAFKGLLRGTIPAKLVGKSVVIAHSHSVGTPTFTTVDTIARNILKRVLEWSVDYGFACSDTTGESKYSEEFMRGKRYAVIPNAIDADKFSYDSKARETVRKRYHLENRFVIGNVGRLSKEKNQKYLLEVLQQIRRKRADAVLLIVGDGELASELKAYAGKLGIGKCVVFTGSVEEPEIYYSAMDVFVMPSLYEGMPFTAVEAQANGLKCVVSDGMTKMVNISGDVVFLSLDDSKNCWAKEIIKSGACRSKFEKTERVRNDYDLKKMVKLLEYYYEKSIGAM